MSKSAVVHRVTVRTDAPTLISTGIEAGPNRAFARRGTGDRVPDGLDGRMRFALPVELERQARALLDALVPVARGFHVSVELAVSRMTTTRSPGPRLRRQERLATVQVRIGRTSATPVWTRTFLWSDPGAGASANRPGLHELCERHAATAQAEPGPDPEWREPALPLAVTADAAADLLRVELGRWRAVGPGVRVAPPSLDVLGHEVPSGSGRRGRPPGPVALARRGVTTRHVTAPRPALGGSWRAPGRPCWPLVEATTLRTAALPERGCLLVAIVPLGRLLCGRGAWIERGAVARSWGPVPIPPAWWWVAHFGDATGPALDDGSGPPVRTPGFLLLDRFLTRNRYSPPERSRRCDVLQPPC